MSEYCHMLCALGVSVKCFTSDRYSSGCCLRSIHERSAKRPTESCTTTDTALDVRDAAAVIWREEYLSALPGDGPSSWCLDTPPTTRRWMRGTRRKHISVLPRMRH
ncbi:surface protease GP63 [Trypanosoma cruzi]|nr:surface protease GP63 [Trypanosoma cruzi]